MTPDKPTPCWYVKDFADGWIKFDKVEDAIKEAMATDAIMFYSHTGRHPLPDHPRKTTTDAAKAKFNLTEADIGRHVRLISTGEIGIVRRDPGNGWIHPGVVYEWKGYKNDLEFVDIFPSALTSGAAGDGLILAHNIITQEIDRINADDGSTEAMNALLECQRRIVSYIGESHLTPAPRQPEQARDDE